MLKQPHREQQKHPKNFVSDQTNTFFDQLAPDRPHINFLADLEQDRTDT